jgi:DNA-binding MarR family transcriptional regulator
MANDNDIASETADAAFRAFLRASGLVRRVMEPFFAQFGISGAQWGVLRALGRAQDDGEPGLRLTDIGDSLLIRPPSVTGVIDRLERMGLVERTSSSQDMRAKYVSLTPAGRELFGRVKNDRKAKVNDILGGLSPREQSDLSGLLRRLGSHLELLGGHESNAADHSKE